MAKKNFEASMARLDEIVKSLERGQTPLDEAEQQVRRLMKGGDEAPVETLFETEQA